MPTPTARRKVPMAGAATASSRYDWATQELLDGYIPLIAGDKRVPRTGYCDVSIDTPGRALTVWWHGAVPQHVNDVRARAARRRVKIVLRPARYDQRTLQPYVQRVADALLGSHGPVTTASVRVDCSGLDVGVTHITDAVRGQIRAVVGPSIPVRVIRQQPLRGTGA